MGRGIDEEWIFAQYEIDESTKTEFQVTKQDYIDDFRAASNGGDGAKVITKEELIEVGRAPALQAGCQEFESPILHNGLEYIRAHVSERKKNRNPTRVGERWEPSWCLPC